jgi:hypothetical protein
VAGRREDARARDRLVDGAHVDPCGRASEHARTEGEAGDKTPRSARGPAGRCARAGVRAPRCARLGRRAPSVGSTRLTSGRSQSAGKVSKSSLGRASARAFSSSSQRAPSMKRPWM